MKITHVILARGYLALWAEQDRVTVAIVDSSIKHEKAMRINKILIFVIIFSLSGCKESSFDMSDDSRLPVWFDVPTGMSRSDVEVTLNYYVRPSGRKAVFILRDRNNRVLGKVTGVQQGMEPINLKQQKEGYPRNRPLYEIVTIEGKTDIIEHRVRGPVFHMADDPSVWKELGVEWQ